ncbi:hypothetical protein Pmar_PMAR002046 [Perkinsus marinus ATCC 50983]|uniref:RING-type domain-containing protein n=1 Tax=Perkinsus marinus (strain ATCC 50983 / TXsc) TaxID=423536 RepID=C5LYI9_PERM5|nr:hypothetical protein Pmar_PMAR002046 [Perkinsus marinus ATCC 50983]EEQ98227.1 hypothetical protein Pmar_PMAR002046 [Perkinsus marinus ATCC 50983]|eukprot:XP_002765510.1 hypothetical protein Pmar_PMAR002046 [Perkinsus marinus ATCC 50983]
MSSCPICLESFVEVEADGESSCGEVSLITLCKHLVHRDCLKGLADQDWFRTKNLTQCPVCKQELADAPAAPIES